MSNFQSDAFAEFPDDPPAHLTSASVPAAGVSLGRTVLRHLYRAAGDAAGAARAAVQSAHFRRTGTRGEETRDLHEAGCPYTVATTGCRMSKTSEILERFCQTPLARAWQETGERELWWARSELRALAFNWVGWKVCVLHTGTWLDTASGYILVHGPGGDLLRIDPVANWAVALDWRPLG